MPEPRPLSLLAAVTAERDEARAALADIVTLGESNPFAYDTDALFYSVVYIARQALASQEATDE